MIENIISKILNEYINTYDDFKKNIITYIKSFGEKGKLESVTKPLDRYYKPCLQEAYKWACESVPGVSRDGFTYFSHLFRNYIVSRFMRNKRGLIYVERSIDFDYSKDLNELNYISIGECWSWKRLNSSSYCADFSLLNENVISVIICGYVHPDSIDWTETIYLNSYGYKNETEIRMNDNALVEVSHIKIGNTKIAMGGSYLINASTDKYKKINN